MKNHNSRLDNALRGLILAVTLAVALFIALVLLLNANRLMLLGLAIIIVLWKYVEDHIIPWMFFMSVLYVAAEFMAAMLGYNL